MFVGALAFDDEFVFEDNDDGRGLLLLLLDPGFIEDGCVVEAKEPLDIPIPD